ncbi:glycosyltransferase family 39 protein [Pseudarthrobacter enclensis]|uniref:glycosyltransferase family 39 protein n=1 Tax=Pseudarthrobacter enclensis TaxID=993070 RepID=UPI0034157AA1
MLGSIDAVHGAYYFLMFGWTRVFGFSELSVRAPSLIAVSLSAVLMVEIGSKLRSIGFGLVAACFLVVLPRTQYVASDARSYALTILGAVAATYVLLLIRENRRPALYVLYAAIGSMTVALSFFAFLLFIGHAVSVCWDGKLRKAWRGLLTASAGWLAPAVVVGMAASRQQFQISWIPPAGPSLVYEFSFLQFFSDAYFADNGHIAPRPTYGEDFSMFALACVLWSAAAAGILMWRSNPLVLRLTLPWLIVPATIVVAGSIATGGNYYLPRYLTFELPAFALLAAAGATALVRLPWFRRRLSTWSAVGLAIVVVLTLPSYAGQRTQFGRDPQDDFRFISQGVEGLSGPGEAFVIGPAKSLVLQAYPEGFKGLGDPTRGISAAEWQRIFDQRFDVASSAEKILPYRTVILVEKRSETAMADELGKLGYKAGESLSGPGTSVTRYSR